MDVKHFSYAIDQGWSVETFPEMDDFLAKPFKRDDLIAALGKWLHQEVANTDA